MQDFEVILNCTSRGRSLEPLVDRPCKYLLPIGNKPLLGYMLEKFELKYQASKITVIVNHINKTEIEDYIKTSYKPTSKVTKISVYYPCKYYSPDPATAPRNSEGAAVTRNPELIDFIQDMWAEGHITKNFIILKGDYLTDMNFHSLIDFHHRNGSDLSLVYEKFEPVASHKKKKEDLAGGPDPFEPTTTDPEDLPIHILEENTNRLIGLIDPDDLDSSKPSIKIKQSILLRHPRVYFNQKLKSRYIAICSLEVCKILHSLKKKEPTKQYFTEFGTDFVKFLATNQYNKKLMELANAKHDSSDELTVSAGAASPENATTISQKDSFRPFVYITDEFAIRIKSFYDLHQANVLRIGKITKEESERGLYELTVNDEASVNGIIPTGSDGNPVEEQKPLVTPQPVASPQVQAPSQKTETDVSKVDPEAAKRAQEESGVSKEEARAQKKAEQAAKKEAARAKEAAAKGEVVAEKSAPVPVKAEAEKKEVLAVDLKPSIQDSQSTAAGDESSVSKEEARAQKKAEQAAKKEAARAKEAAAQGGANLGEPKANPTSAPAQEKPKNKPENKQPKVATPATEGAKDQSKQKPEPKQSSGQDQPPQGKQKDSSKPAPKEEAAPAKTQTLAPGLEAAPQPTNPEPQTQTPPAQPAPQPQQPSQQPPKQDTKPKKYLPVLTQNRNNKRQPDRKTRVLQHRDVPLEKRHRGECAYRAGL